MTDTLVPPQAQHTNDQGPSGKSIVFWAQLGQGMSLILAAIAALAGVIEMLIGIVQESAAPMFGGLGLIFVATAFAGIVMSVLRYIEWQVSSVASTAHSDREG